MKYQATIKIFILTFFIFAMGCVAQQYQPIETTEVVKVSNQDQKAIYNKTRQWFSQYFVSGKSVVDYEDPETGTIIGNGIARIGSDTFGLIQYKIKYNIRIDTKDGKFRAITTIIEHTNTDSSSTYTVHNVSEERTNDAINHVSKIVNDIKAYVTDKKHKSDSNW